MKKPFRIKKNKDFQEVFGRGKSTANRQFVIYVVNRPEQDHYRVGLSVSKKIGNAVMRNRIKRLIRQVVLEFSDVLRSGKDIVIIARKPTAEMDYYEVKSSLEHVWKLAKILNSRK
ncbi:ribonuclease P protein component [Bacillus sp. DJP31]|uniref:ribonuclease P protein component n=1 Tax=Bacillus sp. DJP31 TaxID=3409789 RepID=UPI003BB5F2DF